MKMIPEQYISRLIEISDKKRKLMKEILDLTAAQSGTITEEGVESLEKLIAEKQERIDVINALDEEFDVYFRRLKSECRIDSLDALRDTGTEGIKELQESIGQIMAIAREISELEKQNNEKAKNLLNKFGNEIKKINQGKKINSAYMPGPVGSPSYFIDKKK